MRDGVFQRFAGEGWIPPEDRLYLRAAFMRDFNITPRAAALLQHVLGRPDKKPFSIVGLQREFRGTPAYMGKQAIQSALKSLAAHSYMWRREVSAEEEYAPRYEYIFNDAPIDPGPGWSRRPQINEPIPDVPQIIERERRVRRFFEERWGPPSYVYYAKLDDGAVKIGRSTKPSNRIRRILLTTDYAKERALVDAFFYRVDDGSKAEAQAHHLHAKDRITGQLDLFLLTPTAYEQRRVEMGGVPLDITAIAS